MILNFKQYIDNLLLEANPPTIEELENNYKKVCPYSKDDLAVEYRIEGKETTDMKILGKVKSSKKGSYPVLLELHRDSTDIPWSTKQVVKINCKCNLFRYKLAYPALKNNVLSGKPFSYNRIANKTQNKEQIPAVCKHLSALLKTLVRNKILSDVKPNPIKPQTVNTNQQKPEQNNVEQNNETKV